MMDNEIKNKIEEFLTKDLVYLNINMQGNNAIGIYKPNQDDEFELNTVTLLDTGIYYISNKQDGCNYEYYIPYNVIDYVSCVYGCPQRYGGE